MDTSRIIINTIDNSTSLIENPTAVTGFTVVKAEKGPATPIRISAGGAASLKDIFGVSSEQYPELFEVETFNKEYDVWVSAPYNEAKVPAAYVTNDGIFVGNDLVNYNKDLEGIINGTIDPEIETGIVIKGVTDLSEGINALLDCRYQKTNNLIQTIVDGEITKYEAKDLGEDYYPSYDEKVSIDGTEVASLLVDLGMPKHFFGHQETITVKSTVEGGEAVKLNAWVSNFNKFRIKGFVNNISGEFEIKAFDDKHEKYRLYQNNKVVGVIGTYDATSHSYKEWNVANEYDNLTAIIYGDNALSEPYITNNFVKDYLDQAEERKVLTSFVNKHYDKNLIHGVIIPKYPSNRNMHINFAGFSTLKGYSGTSAVARNIIKMEVYEDNAFHNASHPINITGSLKKSEKDANGAFIGFNNLNSTYAKQNLVFVYSVNPFTENDKINKNITKYPGICLRDGVRVINEGDEESINLHNLGWELAAGGDYSDVDIFFDSSIHENLANMKKSKFFELAKTSGLNTNNHELAGYFFNYTLSPEAVDNAEDSQQLAFGRNYWNVDNHAIIELDDNGHRILSPMTGAKALMQCRIIEYRYGGIAPMWENQGTPSMGGQLKMLSVYKLRYKYDKQQLSRLDDLNFNPIINDRQYGIMCVGQKTCKPDEVTDWSYIGHASAFLNFIKQVRENVMIPQIGKANNPYYRTLRKEQCEQYLAKRLNGNNRIWAEASVDTSTADGVNDIYALKARKFVINIRVKVDVFSETVELNFTNEDQATSIEAK